MGGRGQLDQQCRQGLARQHARHGPRTACSSAKETEPLNTTRTCLPRPALRSVLEIWGAEYQENDCLLIKPEARPLLESIRERERCIMTVRGQCAQGVDPCAGQAVAIDMQVTLHCNGQLMPPPCSQPTHPPALPAPRHTRR